jgi:hypothetical protein
VHPLRADVEPVSVELLISHVWSCGSLSTLQPLLGPPPQFWVTVQGRPGLMHTDRWSHRENVTPSDRDVMLSTGRVEWGGVS